VKSKSIFILFCTCITAWAAAQIDVNKTVLIINGEEVKGNEYYGRMESLPNVGTSLNGKYAEAPPGFLAMQRLIEERLLMALAKEKGLFPTDAEIQAVIKERTDADPKYLDKLTTSGFTLKDLTYALQLDLSEFKLTTMGITITDQEVDKFYKDNPTMFITPKNYKLRIIAVETDGGKTAVDQELAKGTPFPDVAKKFSIDASRFNGGESGNIAEANFSDSVKAALQKTKIGMVTEWIRGDQTWVKFLIEGINPEAKIALDDKIRKNLRRKLMLDRGRVKNDVAAMMRNMRKKAVIEVKQPQFVQAIKEYMDSAKLGATGG